jgi:uncharacterized membrane protein YqjE
LERLLTASQGVVTKRIDLALLEAQEMVTHGLESIFVLVLNVVWIAAAWFALTIWAITVVLGDHSFADRVAAFGLLNAAAAVAGILMIRRWVTPRKEAE